MGDPEVQSSGGGRKNKKQKTKGGGGAQASESVPVEEKIGKNFFFLFMRGYLTALSLSALRGRGFRSACLRSRRIACHDRCGRVITSVCFGCILMEG